jgi:signal transduction protein with GAF and PtsI domain
VKKPGNERQEARRYGAMDMNEARKKVEEAVAAERPLKDVLTIVIEEACKLSGAESCSVVMLDRGRNELVFFSIGGIRERSIEEVRFPANRGITGDVVKTGQSNFVNDPVHDTRFYDRIDDLSGLITRNIMAAPLRFEGRIIGAIDILNKPGGFDRQDLRTLDEFCLFAGEALGKSGKLADEIKSGQYLVKKFQATMNHLIKYKR